MFFLTALSSLLSSLFIFYYNKASNIPSYASHQELSTSKLPNRGPKKIKINNNGSYVILLKNYSEKKLNHTSPIFYNETVIDLSTIQLFFHYYDILQILQSPYVSQHKKIQIIEREQIILPTFSHNLKNGLDW